MLPFEIIWRRYNVEGNSWEQRNPKQLPVGQKYEAIKYEACLKWSVKSTAGEEIHDPFMMLDENFDPLLNIHGLPRLIHPKKPDTEIEYTEVFHPNK